jgi:hypothetical protein
LALGAALVAIGGGAIAVAVNTSRHDPTTISQSHAATHRGLSPVPLGPGTKVLQIGDSHTVGPFGQAMDRALRKTGAEVATYGSSGSSPQNYIDGTGTVWYSETHGDGVPHVSPYGEYHATPKLEELIAREKPNLLLVNLGTNFRSTTPEFMRHQVDEIGEIARQHNLPLIWVGAPKWAKDNSDPSDIQAVDTVMKAAVAPYGTYLPSSQFIPRYNGDDAQGIHYTGRAGVATAQKWADGVFHAIAGTP